MKHLIFFAAVLSTLVLPEFCTNKPHVTYDGYSLSNLKGDLKFRNDSQYIQRSHFLAAIGLHLEGIDQGVQFMETIQPLGPIEKRRLAFRNINETRILLRDIRERLSYQNALNIKLWQREKLELIASMNDLTSKYKLIQSNYH